MAVPATSNSKVLIEKALHLFKELYEPGRKVRLIGVRFADLSDGNYQINMFDDREKDILLYKAIDEMKNKHGSGKIVLAQNLGLGNVKQNGLLGAINKEAKQEDARSRKKDS